MQPYCANNLVFFWRKSFRKLFKISQEHLEEIISQSLYCPFVSILSIITKVILLNEDQSRNLSKIENIFKMIFFLNFQVKITEPGRNSFRIPTDLSTHNFFYCILYSGNTPARILTRPLKKPTAFFPEISPEVFPKFPPFFL